MSIMLARTIYVRVSYRPSFPIIYSANSLLILMKQRLKVHKTGDNVVFLTPSSSYNSVICILFVGFSHQKLTDIEDMVSVHFTRSVENRSWMVLKAQADGLSNSLGAQCLQAVAEGVIILPITLLSHLWSVFSVLCTMHISHHHIGGFLWSGGSLGSCHPPGQKNFILQKLEK